MDCNSPNANRLALNASPIIIEAGKSINVDTIDISIIAKMLEKYFADTMLRVLIGFAHRNSKVPLLSSPAKRGEAATIIYTVMI